jgi:hypothetical protein
MAIWTNGSQVLDRVHFVLNTDPGQQAKVMDVDQSREVFSIDRDEIHGADTTLRAIVFDAPTTSHLAPFVGVNRYQPSCSFVTACRLGNLLRQKSLHLNRIVRSVVWWPVPNEPLKDCSLLGSDRKVRVLLDDFSPKNRQILQPRLVA